MRQYREEGCYISAYDAGTGKQAWKFYTIAREGQPGGDTWGTLPNLLRAGGDTWITGRYDPDSNDYWGIAQAKPWLRVSRGAKPGDKGLFTNSTLALDPDNGTLQWHFQHVPGETFDLDEVFERVLVDRGNKSCSSRSARRASFGNSTARPASSSTHKETVFQNVFTRIDPKTGEPTYRSDILEQQIGQWLQICPSTEGGHNWQAMSYHPGNSATDHPAEPELHGDVGPQSGIQGGFGRWSGGPPLLRDAEHQRKNRQTGGLRRATR